MNSITARFLSKLHKHLLREAYLCGAWLYLCFFFFSFFMKPLWDLWEYNSHHDSSVLTPLSPTTWSALCRWAEGHIPLALPSDWPGPGLLWVRAGKRPSSEGATGQPASPLTSSPDLSPVTTSHLSLPNLSIGLILTESRLGWRSVPCTFFQSVWGCHTAYT